MTPTSRLLLSLLTGWMVAMHPSVHAADVVECGPSDQTIVVAGSTTVYPLVEVWAEHYMNACAENNITIVLEAGGSSSGATRVCGGTTSSGGGPVDIGNMSRDWLIEEALPYRDLLYQCIVGDQARSALQVPVALDGLAIAVAKNGTAAQCLQIMGGLTTDQLRWIFTNYDEGELMATGWDLSSIANNDGDESTHLWSELDSRCPAVEIKIAGPTADSGTFEYFHQTILVGLDAGETHASDRPDGYFNSLAYKEIVAYIEANGDAIAFFAYYLFLQDAEKLYAVPILNDEGDYVASTQSSVADGSYNPLSRRIYMNMLNSVESLANTRPFLEFAFSNNGTALVGETGLVAIPEDEQDLILASLPEPGESFDMAPVAAPTEASAPTDTTTGLDTSGGATRTAILSAMVGAVVFFSL